jgi:hypothetical protein
VAVLPFPCDISHLEQSQGFVMFVLSLVRKNKTVCSLDATKAQIQLHHVQRKTFWIYHFYTKLYCRKCK